MNKILYTFTLVVFVFNLNSQVNFTNNCSSTSGWTQGGSWGNSTTTLGSCTSTNATLRANLWSSAPSLSLSRNAGTSLGGQMTVNVDFTVIAYSGGAASPSSYFSLKFQKSTDGTTWTDVQTLPHTPSTTCQTATFTYTPDPGNTYFKLVYTWLTTGDMWAHINNVSIVETVGPAISVSGSLSAFAACNGGNSAEQSFSVSGSSLTDDITITPPTGYEISTTSGAGFTSSIVLSQTAGSVGNTTIYVRTKTSATSGDGGNIVCSSTDATTKNVATGSATLSSNIYYVATTGSDANNGLTSGTPFATIQHAIDNLNTSCGNAIIYIADGTYDQSNIDIDVSLSIIGESESGTIIDNSDVSGEYCFKVTTDNSDVTLKNLTIRNFKGDAGCAFRSYIHDNKVVFDAVTVNSCYILSSATYDGAVFIFHDTGATASDSIVIKNCTFSDNYSAQADYATALFVGSYSYDYDYPVLITNCVFDNNDSDGSVYSYGAVNIDRGYSAEVTKCIFKNNTGHGYNSGLRLGHIGSSGGTAGRSKVENCLFHDNSLSFAGAAIGFDYAYGTLTNCTFAQNSNTSADAYYVSNIYASNSTIAVKNCIIQSDDSGNEMIDGSTVSYSIIYGGSGGDTYTNGGNNSSSDPLFTNAASNDFTLTSSSDCIDNGTSTGAPADDLAGNSRDATPDIGCYELASNQWDGSASSDWKTAANWSDNTVPTTESVIIPTSGSYTNPPIIDESDAVCGSISLQGDAVLTLSSGKLTATGSVSMASTSEIQFDGGELECSGKFSADGILDINSGTLDVDGEFEVGSTLTEQITGGTIEVAGDFDGASEGDGDFTPTGGTVELNGATATTVDNHASASFYNLTVNKSANGSTLSSNLTVTNNLTVTAGTLAHATYTNTVTGATDINSTVTLSTGTLDANGSFDATGGTITFSGAGNLNLGSTVTSLGTFTESTSTVLYDAAGAQNVIADNYYNLTIGGSGTKTSQGTINISNNFTLNAGTYDVDATTNTVTGISDVNSTLSISTGTFNADGTFDATGGTIDFTGAGNLTLSSTVTSLGTLDDAMGTITYDGATQSVLADSYYNLSIETAGTKTAGGALDVNGDLTTAATANCKLDLGAYDLNVAGDLSVGATDGLDASDALCLVTIDGSGDQTLTHAGNTGSSSTIELLNHDFSGAETGWTTNNYGSGNEWDISSQAYAKYVYHASNTANTWFWTEAITITGTEIDVTYDIWARSGSFPEKLKVYLCSSQTNTGTLLATHSSISNTSASTQTVNKTGVTPGTYYIGFYCYSSANMWELYVDDIIVTEERTSSGSELTEFTINKASGNLILSSEINVDGTLTFTSGDIDATTNNLIFTANGTTTGASDASHVNGTVVKTTESTSAFTFPIGDGTTYRPIGITPDGASSTDWTASYTASSHPDTDVDGSGLDHISTQEYWDLDRSGSANASISLTWSAANGVTDYTELTIAHYDGTTDWDMIASTPSGNNTSGTINSDAAVTTFSPFTIGSTGSANPLPVNLVAFYGENKNQINNLKWITASEKNSDYFTVEKTTDGILFETVGTRQGAGNSIYHTSYLLVDDNVEPVVNYYRLKQTDFDGNSKYSNLISIDNRLENQKDKTLLRITNTWGQEVKEDFRGVVIYIYSDGSIERVFQN